MSTKGPSVDLAVFLFGPEVFHTARAKSSASQQKDRRSITAVFFVLVNDTHLLSTVHCVDEEVIE